MIITRLHIGIAILVALVLHGGLAVWLVLPEKDPEPEPLKQVVRISLQSTIAETTLTESKPVPEPILKPVVKPKAKPELAPEPKPIPKAKPKPKPVVQQQQIDTEPVVKPVAEVERVPEEVTREIIREEIKVTDLPPLDTDAAVKYEELLQAWLEKHKRYPKRAKRMRIEGEGVLRILIDRSGQTQKVVLEQSTGNRLLDKAALEMVKRANPFPAMAEKDPRRSLEFTVPVEFSLR